MWECGVVDNPYSPPTRIIVLSLSDDVPLPLENRTYVRLDEDGILRFTHDFHRTSRFFPRTKQAYRPDLSNELIKTRAGALWGELEQVLPEPEPPAQKGEPERCWLSLKLSLDGDSFDLIRQRQGSDEEA